MATKAELEQEVRSLTRKLAISKGSHEALKRKVVEVAKRGCERHGWCDEVQGYIRELKLAAYWPSEWIIQRRWSRIDTWDDYCEEGSMAEAARVVKEYRDAEDQGRQYRLVERTLNRDKVVRGA